MLKILRVFVDKCVTAGRYGPDNCLFNAKLVAGVFVWLNLLTIISFLFKRDDILKVMSLDRVYGWSAFLCVIFVYVYLTIAYPKKKIMAINVSEKEKKRIFSSIFIYIGVTAILFVIALSTS